MRKFLFGATLVVAAALMAQTSFAGPACCKKKGDAETVAAKSTCSKSQSSCNSAMTVAAESSCSKSGDGFPQIRFMVAGEAYDTQPEAWAALAEASEKYVERYTSIACVVDGKVKYCGEDSCASKGAKTAKASCNSAAEVKLASAASSCDSKAKARAHNMQSAMVKRSCCGSKKADLVKADGKGCSESKGTEVKLASAKDERVCPLTGKVVTVDDKGNSSCCKKPCGDEAEVKTVAAESKSGCCKSKMASLAKAEGKSCGEKVELVKADDAKSGCCKSKMAKLAKAEGKSCSEKVELVKADDAKSGCCKSKMAKLAKAESKESCSSKTAALVSAENKTCDKGAALVKADGCSKATEAKLAKADGCCKDAKNVMYRVARSHFKTYEEADAAREKAVEAMKGVKMAYVVDGQKVDCSSKVCPTMKKAGKVKFVVDKTETNCELQARVSLAKAQMEAVQLAVNDMVATAN